MGNPNKSRQPAIIASFCHASQNCCPTLTADVDAPPSKELVITDDFGNKVFMSREQMRGFVEKAKAGEIVV